MDNRKGLLVVVVGLGEGAAAAAAHVCAAPLDLAACTFSGATAGEEKAEILPYLLITCYCS